jgi:DNA-binding NtrC family response regulator
MPITKSRLDVAGDQSHGPDTLSGLAISPFAEDLSFLEQKFQDAGWPLYTAHTYREALAQLTHERMPIVICERQLPDGSWKDVLNRITAMVDRPRLIVVARHADERLWAEVLYMGAFDLLSIPFREEELAFTIGSAWVDWIGERERRRSRSLRRSFTA